MTQYCTVNNESAVYMLSKYLKYCKQRKRRYKIMGEINRAFAQFYALANSLAFKIVVLVSSSSSSISREEEDEDDEDEVP